MSDVPFQNKNSSMSRLQPGFMDWRKNTNKSISRGLRKMYRTRKTEDTNSLASAVVPDRDEDD